MSDKTKAILLPLAVSLAILFVIAMLVYFGNKHDAVSTEEECYEKGHVVEVDHNGKMYCDSGRDTYHID